MLRAYWSIYLKFIEKTKMNKTTKTTTDNAVTQNGERGDRNLLLQYLSISMAIPIYKGLTAAISPIFSHTTNKTWHRPNAESYHSGHRVLLDLAFVLVVAVHSAVAVVVVVLNPDCCWWLLPRIMASPALIPPVACRIPTRLRTRLLLDQE